MTEQPLSERERQLAWLREAYAKAAAGPIRGPLGAHGLSLLAILISLLETGWDDRSRAAIAKARRTTPEG
jgi:hypothetical protein